jgi:hypothetical protein
MEWAMQTYLNDEAIGAKAFTWAIIAASALLLVEVTWPQALPAPAVESAVVSVSAHPGHVAKAG